MRKERVETVGMIVFGGGHGGDAETLRANIEFRYCGDRDTGVRRCIGEDETGVIREMVNVSNLHTKKWLDLNIAGYMMASHCSKIIMAACMRARGRSKRRLSPGWTRNYRRGRTHRFEASRKDKRGFPKTLQGTSVCRSVQPSGVAISVFD